MTIPNYPIDSNIPADQQMLLRLIDAKFDTTNAKLEGIASTLTVMNDRFGRYDKKFSEHDARLSIIEGDLKVRQLQVADYERTKMHVEKIDSDIGDLRRWQTEEVTTSRNASRWGGFAWSVVGSGVTALVIFLAAQFLDSKKQPSHSVQATELHKLESVTTNHR